MSLGAQQQEHGTLQRKWTTTLGEMRSESNRKYLGKPCGPISIHEKMKIMGL